MRQPETWRAAAALLLAAAAAGAHADDALFRYRAPVAIERAAPFVQMPLPVSAYARTRQPELRDLRLVDARGERVPFALLAPRVGGAERVEQGRYATIYALPPRPAAAGADWPSPVEVTINGDKVQVQRRSTGTAPEDGMSPGWLIDLGDLNALRLDEPRPELLRLAWSGPAEFTAALRLETSDDLKTWRPGGSSQVLELNAEGRTLTQPDVALPEGTGRFVRLVWQDPAAAPHLASVRAISVRRDRGLLDPPAELVLAPAPAASAPEAKGELTFDLGAILPIETLDLRLPAGTQVLPLRWQGRDKADAVWRDLGASVAYRIERDGAVTSAPPLRLGASARYLRALPDERAAAPDRAVTRLVAQVRLAAMVFATQGTPPFVLLAGADAADVGYGGALPVASLVPSLDDERARFGQARLGEWREVPEAARRAEDAERRAAWRPWLLWGVLVAGVAGLGWMVWRLAREGAKR